MLRSENINTEIYLDFETRLKKQLKYTDKKRIPFAIIFGSEKFQKNTIILKNLKTRI